MLADSTRLAVRVRITGRVQGVWFRAWTVEQAEGLNIDGWVRNRADGTVEALFVGERSAVDQIVAACHNGPRAARVDDVSIVDANADVPPGSGFRTRESA